MERRVEFVRRARRATFPKLPPPSIRAAAWCVALLAIASVVCAFYLARLVIESRDASMMFGHVMTEGLMRRAAIEVGFLLFVPVALIPPAVLLARTIWDRMVVDDEGVTVARRGRTERAAWAEIECVEMRSARGVGGLLRTGRFVVELTSFHPTESTPGAAWRLPRLAETEIFRELVTTRRVPVRRRWLRWRDASLVVVVLGALLRAVAVDHGVGRGHFALAYIDADPAETLRAADTLLARRSDDGFVRQARAEALFALGRVAEARADVDRAVDDDPSCELTWVTRKRIADASGDPKLAVSAWTQAHPGLGNFDDRRPTSPAGGARWRMAVGRRLFMASDFERARRWFVAAEREAHVGEDGDAMARRIRALVALCDVAIGRPEAALTLLAGDEDSMARRHVETLALRCLGREQEIDAVLSAGAPKPPRSEKLRAASATIDAWLRGEPVELPTSLVGRSSDASLAQLDAPLLAHAWRLCAHPPL